MIISSFAVIPFGFFDYLSQPGYWHPQTLFSIPVGIEGIVFGFTIGGIAAVIFNENIHLETYQRTKLKLLSSIIIPLCILLVSFVLYAVFGINMMISLPIGMTSGILLLIILRPKLRKVILFSALYFGLLYLFLFTFWLQLFPQAVSWWNLNIYSGVTILGVPFGEVLFGFLYGGLWGPLYHLFTS